MNSAKILVLQEDLESQVPYKVFLKKEGYSTYFFPLVETEFHRIFELDIDLILLEFSKTSFKEMLLLLRKLSLKNENIPVILVSPYYLLAQRIQILQSGVDVALPQIPDSVELLAYLRVLIRRYSFWEKHDTYKKVLTYDELHLDRLHRVAYRCSQKIPLTTQQYRLLEYFMFHPGEILTRQQISKEIWGSKEKSYAYYGVDVYVRSLRKKMDIPFAFPLILSLRGKGYMFYKSPLAPSNSSNLSNSSDLNLSNSSDLNLSNSSDLNLSNSSKNRRSSCSL
jgi:DNA-binding response OmpR family regulator